jgi:hypothetical protein
MQTKSRGESDVEMARGKHSAARFFWMWLIVATLMSIIGNVTHAALHAAAGTVGLASGAALVPPVVLLAATHSVAVLVRTRAGGLTYWCALTMTVVLASCAFVLSFDALRSLAITLGLASSIAWLWPCSIDVAIAQATLCLLSLSRRHTPAPVARTSTRPAHGRPAADLPCDPRATADAVTNRSGPPGAAASRIAALPRASDDCVNTAAIQRWQPVAESLVRGGVTSKHPRLVATILAQREAGVPPSTIGRRHKVHHSTVGRILTAAEALTA